MKNERLTPEYWQQKITITTECPVCHKDYTREIHPEELCNYQTLVICLQCEKWACGVTAAYRSFKP
jgi:hypothetical protein